MVGAGWQRGTTANRLSAYGSVIYIDIVATPISGNHGTKADQTNNALSKATLGKSWSVLRESTLNGFGGEDGPTMVIICCRVQPLKKMSRRKRKWTL